MQDTSSTSSSLQFASFFERLMALISDWLILNLISLFSFNYLLSATGRVDLFTRLILLVTLVLIPASIFNLIYHVWFLSQQGATPGKKIWGVKIVTDNSGENLSVSAAFMREVIMKRVSAFFFGLGFWWFWKSSTRQTWHDLLIGSHALKTEIQPASSFFMFSVIVVANIYFVDLIVDKIPNIVGLFL